MSIDWGEVYRSCYRDVVRFLHRKVWDDERAHDLAQEAFARSLEHAPENPRAWLFQVAGNLARDEARLVLRRKRHLALLRTEAELAASVPPAAPRELERREREAQLRAALDQLGERDREVLLLWDAGLDYTAIAAQTGLAPGAIGTTLSRARKRLIAAHDALEAEHAARG